MCDLFQIYVIICRSLSDTRQQSESDKISHLRESLAETEEQARTSKRNEQLLLAERDQLEAELGTKKKDNQTLQTKLDKTVITMTCSSLQMFDLTF